LMRMFTILLCYNSCLFYRLLSCRTWPSAVWVWFSWFQNKGYWFEISNISFLPGTIRHSCFFHSPWSTGMSITSLFRDNIFSLFDRVRCRSYFNISLSRNNKNKLMMKSGREWRARFIFKISN
jgi:hypothetical protein